MQTAMLVMMLGALSVTGAANGQATGGNPPVEITSDMGEFLRQEGRGVFTGNVVASRAGARITTDKLTLTCSRSAPVAMQERCEPERLVAEGNVLYAAADLKIRGDHAAYDYVSNTITVTGDVVMARGADSIIRGTRAVYDVSSGAARITGGDRITGYFGGPPN